MQKMEGFVRKYVLYYIKYDLADFVFLPLLYYLKKILQHQFYRFYQIVLESKLSLLSKYTKNLIFYPANTEMILSEREKSSIYGACLTVKGLMSLVIEYFESSSMARISFHAVSHIVKFTFFKINSLLSLCSARYTNSWRRLTKFKIKGKDGTSNERASIE